MVVKDSIIYKKSNTDTLKQVVDLDSLPKSSNLQPDTIQTQIVSITNMEKESIAQNASTITTQQVTKPEVKKLERHIQKLKSFRQNEFDKIL